MKNEGVVYGHDWKVEESYYELCVHSSDLFKKQIPQPATVKTL